MVQKSQEDEVYIYMLMSRMSQPTRSPEVIEASCAIIPTEKKPIDEVITGATIFSKKNIKDRRGIARGATSQTAGGQARPSSPSSHEMPFRLPSMSTD